MTFGERLRELRIAKGFNAKTFYLETKVSASTLSQYENDIAYPSFSKLAFMLKKLNVSAEEFFKGVELY